MSTAGIHLKVLAPDHVSFEGTVTQVSVPTLDGILTILPEHAPIVAVVTTGELVVTDTQGMMHVFAVFSGVLDVRPHSEVYVLVDRSERAESIDIERAEAAVVRAKDLLENKINESDVDFARFEAVLEKELNRVRVAIKWRK